MIHIATVHWQTNAWIEIQVTYLKKHLAQPFRLYGFWNNVESEFEKEFYYVSKENIESHAIKLNLLADFICQNSDKEDIIVFLDGDAFPISSLDNYLNIKLNEYPLIAILIKIELGDQQPHPSFCATTIGFWKEIKGDWKMGNLWKDNRKERVTDVGGNLLFILRQNNIEWFPMLRTRSLSTHPVFYGVYDRVVYHHGAGFRKGNERSDLSQMNLINKLCRSLSLFLKSIAGFLEIRWRAHVTQKILEPRKTESDDMLAKIKKNKWFFDQD